MESRKAKKQHSLARFNWIGMKMYLKNREVERERQELNEKILEKLDVFAGPASKRIMEKTMFNPSVHILNKMTRSTLQPLKRYRKQRNNCQSIEQVAGHSAFRVLSKLADPMPAILKISKSVTPSSRPLRRLCLVKHHIPNVNRKIDDVAKHFAKDAFKLSDFSSLFGQIQPLVNHPAARRCITHQDDEEFLLNQISATAVGQPDLSYGVSRLNTANNMLRPLLRLAYPTKDPSVPFEAAREATMSGSDDEDNFLISIDAFTPRDRHGHKIFTFDLSELEEDIDREGKEVTKRITAYEKRLKSEKISNRRMQERKIRHETVEQSCSFVDDIIEEGLMEFACSIVGLDNAVEEAVNFQSSMSKQNLALAVSMSTLGNAKIISPFLWGAANVKMHKLKQDDQEKK